MPNYGAHDDFAEQMSAILKDIAQGYARIAQNADAIAQVKAGRELCPACDASGWLDKYNPCPLCLNSGIVPSDGTEMPPPREVEI